MIEESTIEINYKQNPMLCYAWRIAKGEAEYEYTYCLQENKFYIFENGLWKQLFDIEFLGRVSQKIHEITKHSIGERKQIVDNFKLIKYMSLNNFNWGDMLNLKNGMLSPYDGSMMSHDTSFYSTIRLPYEFNEESSCPLWIKTLEEILEESQEKINILQEFFGYCLTKDTKQHKALLLLGESRSGKSTILQTLRAVVGIENCSSVPLKYISNPQYTPLLINKLVNIDTDVSAKASEFEAEFKTITSGEPVSCNQKYAPAFDFIPHCKVVMAANIFPKITDHSSAFYKRLLLIPCDRVFDDQEQNRDLPKQLLSELPGILNWAIKGLKRLNTRGRFEQCDFIKEAVQELENENNPVNLFFDEFIETNNQSDVSISKSELYAHYIDWTNKTNNFKLSQARFASCVYKRFSKFTPKDARDTHTKKRIWRNLKYIDPKIQPTIDKGWQQ